MSKNNDNVYPDYEQSWLTEEHHQTYALPQCGLVVKKSGDDVKFYDDEFPILQFSNSIIDQIQKIK